MGKNLKKGLVFSIIFIIVGGLVMWLGINRILSYNNKQKEYIEIEAVVVEHKYPEMSEDGAKIVVEYEVDGQKYSIISDEQTTNPKSLGSKVKVMYNPNNPEEAIFESNSNYFIVIVGLIFTLAGIFVFYQYMSIKKNAKKLKYDQTNINNIIGPNNM